MALMNLRVWVSEHLDSKSCYYVKYIWNVPTPTCLGAKRITTSFLSLSYNLSEIHHTRKCVWTVNSCNGHMITGEADIVSYVQHTKAFILFRTNLPKNSDYS
ncbi:hypothetical protein ACJX0J_007018 [Zea mays]